MSVTQSIQVDDVHPQDRDLIGRVFWLFERWAPSELEPLDFEAHGLISDLAIALLDARRDATEAREILSSALDLARDQDEQLDDLRRRRRELVPAA